MLIVNKCKFVVSKNVAKLAFFEKEIWHILKHKEMLIFQVFHDFDNIVFEVEVGMQYRKIWHIYQKGLFNDKLLVCIGGDESESFYDK